MVRVVTSGLILTIAARSDLAKDASRILIRLSQIVLINVAFAAYVLENVILLFSPGVAFALFFKAPPWGFCMNRPVSRGLGELSPLERIITSHYPGELSPLERIITSHYPGDYLGYYTTVWRKVTCSPYLDYFISYPFSSQTFWSIVLCF